MLEVPNAKEWKRVERGRRECRQGVVGGADRQWGFKTSGEKKGKSNKTSGRTIMQYGLEIKARGAGFPAASIFVGSDED